MLLKRKQKKDRKKNIGVIKKVTFKSCLLWFMMDLHVKFGKFLALFF